MPQRPIDCTAARPTATHTQRPQPILTRRFAPPHRRRKRGATDDNARPANRQAVRGKPPRTKATLSTQRRSTYRPSELLNQRVESSGLLQKAVVIAAFHKHRARIGQKALKAAQHIQGGLGILRAPHQQNGAMQGAHLFLLIRMHNSNKSAPHRARQLSIIGTAAHRGFAQQATAFGGRDAHQIAHTAPWAQTRRPDQNQTRHSVGAIGNAYSHARTERMAYQYGVLDSIMIEQLDNTVGVVIEPNGNGWRRRRAKPVKIGSGTAKKRAVLQRKNLVGTTPSVQKQYFLSLTHAAMIQRALLLWPTNRWRRLLCPYSTPDEYPPNETPYFDITAWHGCCSRAPRG